MCACIRNSLCLILVFSLAACAGAPDLKVMSFNVRYGAADDGEHSWAFRREAAAAAVREAAPAVFGVQEALDFQLDFFEQNCPAYRSVGVGREDGAHEGEHMSVFFDTTRVDLLDWGTYWLSETPDVPSLGWDAACKRTATWLLLKDKAAGREFFFVNTHLDHVGKEARRKGLALVVSSIKEMNPEGWPMVLCGDFNVTPDDECLTDLRLLMDDARETAALSDHGTTWHDWGRLDDTPPIDYLFYKGFRACRSFARITDKPYVSDHYPVVAVLAW
jgi:endonuclease/exonuclease/phosphatase family metal-dependent hydrolase